MMAPASRSLLALLMACCLGCRAQDETPTGNVAAQPSAAPTAAAGEPEKQPIDGLARARAELFGVEPIGLGGIELTTPFSRIRLSDLGTERSLYFIRDSGEAVLETRMVLTKPEQLVVRYTQLMFASYLFQPKQARVLLVGLGGGAMVRFLQHHEPELHIDAIDIDPQMPKLAEDYFGTKPDDKRRFIVADGYEFIRNTEHHYDAIYMDAFLNPSDETDGIGVPLDLKKTPFYEAMQERLNTGGVVVFNLNAHPGMNEDFRRIESVFAQAYLFAVPDTENWVVVGATAPGRLSQALLETAGRELDQRFETTFSFHELAQGVKPKGQLPKG